MTDLPTYRKGVTEYWYLATPYSKYPEGLNAAWVAACEAAGHLVRQGRTIYCPIAHTHPIAIYGQLNPLDHEIWLPLDKPFMDNAIGLIVVKMPSWQDSYGISVEIDVFQAAGKPIEYMEWPIEGG